MTINIVDVDNIDTMKPSTYIGIDTEVLHLGKKHGFEISVSMSVSVSVI